MTTWHADTCYCIIEFDDTTGNFVSTIQRCTIHDTLTGQTLLDTVRAHNMANNTTVPNPTDAQIQASVEARSVLKETTRP